MFCCDLVGLFTVSITFQVKQVSLSIDSLSYYLIFVLNLNFNRNTF